MAIVGGRYALKRKKWVLALIGSICAAIGGGVIGFYTGSYGSYIPAGLGVLGIPATFLIALSKDEFE